MPGLEETMDVLRQARSWSSSALVAYSGGKDSIVVMDMACRTFDHVEGVFKYLVPDLRVSNEIVASAKSRWGVTVHQYPSQNGIQALKNGIFCDPSDAFDGLPDLTSWHIYAAAIRDTKIPLVMTGMKRSDSQSRRRLMQWQSANRQVIHPIAGWEKIDVLGYLRMRNIPLPAGSGSRTSGVELAPSELLWLADAYPDDFAKLRRYFKYIDAVTWRRKFYGEEESGIRRRGSRSGRSGARKLRRGEAAAVSAD